MKESLKPCACKLWDAARAADRVLFVERSGELRGLARLRAQRPGAVGRPSLKRAQESAGAGPKPGDLPMPRLKLP